LLGRLYALQNYVKGIFEKLCILYNFTLSEFCSSLPTTGGCPTGDEGNAEY